MIIDNLFQHKINHHVKKHKLLVRKILTKLIRRCSIAYMTKIMPEFHRPMLSYIEKQKRKSENKKQKDKLLALMGQDGNDQDDGAMKEDDVEDSDEISSDEENEIARNKKDAKEEDSEDSRSESEDDRGYDHLQANAFDIPRVDDIPIVSKLAKMTEKDKLAEMDGQQQ